MDVDVEFIKSTTGKSLHEIVLDIKSNTCVQCLLDKEDSSKNTLNLDCSCLVCSSSCIESLFQILYFNFNKNKAKGLYCLCGSLMNNRYLVYLSFRLNNLPKASNIIRNVIRHTIGYSCCLCCEIFQEEYRYTLTPFIVEDSLLRRELNSDTVFHIACSNCIDLIVEDQNFNCRLCQSSHKVKAIKSKGESFEVF